jgi:hypothetical protein
VGTARNSAAPDRRHRANFATKRTMVPKLPEPERRRRHRHGVRHLVLGDCGVPVLVRAVAGPVVVRLLEEHGARVVPLLVILADGIEPKSAMLLVHPKPGEHRPSFRDTVVHA